MFALFFRLTPLGKVLALSHVAEISHEREAPRVSDVSGVGNVSGASDEGASRSDTSVWSGVGNSGILMV